MSSSLNSTINLFDDYDVLIRTVNKVLRKNNLQRLINTLKLLILILLAIVMAWLIWSILSLFSSTSDLIDSTAKDLELKLSSGSPLNNNALDSENSFPSLTKKNIFGTLKAKPTPTPKSQTTVSTLPLSLIGTFITRGEDPYAIIEDKKSRTQEIFIPGDQVFETATLEKIKSTSVIIKRNGQLETLVIDDSPEEGSSDSGEEDGEVVNVDEGELDGALANLPLLLTQARAVPYFKDGKPVGLRLFAIKRGSLYEKVGLKNGDILKTINGKNLGNISEAMKLFQNLKEERNLTLVLERNRQPQTIRYQIR